MKQCPNCNKEKEYSEFHKNKRNISGLESWCKKCANDKRKNKSSYKASTVATSIENNINHVKKKKLEWKRIKVGDTIRGLKVIFKNSNFMVLIDTKRSYRKITYTINDFITNTK